MGSRPRGTSVSRGAVELACAFAIGDVHHQHIVFEQLVAVDAEGLEVELGKMNAGFLRFLLRLDACDSGSIGLRREQTVVRWKMEMGK